MVIMASEFPFKSSIGDDLIKKSLAALLKQHTEQLATKDSKGRKSVFADAVKSSSKHTIKLDIMTFKVPIAVPRNPHRPLHPKINRLPLPHSLNDGNTSVLLVTKDIKKQTSALTNAHYLEMLTNANCNHLITEIMSLQQLKDEYSEVEARLDLCARTDVVLCEKAIVSIVPRLLGRPFVVAKKNPMAVNLGQSNLLKQITKFLNFTSHKMTFRNTQSSLSFGRVHQKPKEMQENLTASLEYLCSDKFPGGWKNIKTLYLTLGLKSRVPLYVSTGLSSDVPDIEVKKTKVEVLEGDFGFGPVKITSSGEIIKYQPLSDDEDGHVEKKRKLKKVKRTGKSPARPNKKARLEKKPQASRKTTTSQKKTGAAEKPSTAAQNKAMKKLKKASRIHFTPVEKGIMDGVY